jgi:hypothetical protein
MEGGESEMEDIERIAEEFEAETLSEYSHT